MFGHFLKGKTAIITGSISGIGLGIARSMAGAGADIVLNGFAADDEIKRIQTELNSANQKAKFIFADVSKPADCRSLIQKSIQHFGKVDILVNNAGTSHTSKVESFPQDIWEKIISLNLSAAFYTSRYALPGMKERKWGRIINVASAAGLVGLENAPVYVATKHGVVGFTKAVALQNAKSGVTVNAICPGFIETPMLQRQFQGIAEKNKMSIEQVKAYFLKSKHPNEQFGTSEDIGALATFLCTDNARQMTGGSYTSDGGLTAQ